MPVSQLVAQRNKRPGVTVLTPDPRDPKNYLEFQAAGDPGGGDVQYISEETATLPTCVKAIMHGVFELEQDTLSPDVARSFQQQMMVAKRQREQAEQQITQTIDRTENKDLISAPCVGPGTQAGKNCADSVPVRERDLKDSPPLCSRHAGLFREYVPTEDFDGEKHTTRWVRASMGPREQEQR